MFITVHAAAGALIGTEISNPYAAFGAGVVLHFIMDVIPHGDRELGKKFFGLLNKKLSEEEKLKSLAAYAMMDYIILIFFLIYAFKTFYFTKQDGVTWAIVGSILPDLLVASYMLTKSRWLKWFFNFHNWMHHLIIHRMKHDVPLQIGIAYQIILFAILFIALTQINLIGPYFEPFI